MRPHKHRAGSRWWRQERRVGSVTGGNRRIFLFVGQQVRAAAVGDLRDVYTSSEGAGGLARGFALWSYHRIDDAGLHHAADRGCRLRLIAADLFPNVRQLA